MYKIIIDDVEIDLPLHLYGYALTTMREFRGQLMFFTPEVTTQCGLDVPCGADLTDSIRRTNCLSCKLSAQFVKLMMLGT